MGKKVTIRGKTYNLDETADLVSIQNAIVPENWPGKKADGVRHFLALQEMAALQFRRHFAANFKQLAKAALEEGSDGGTARIGISFATEIDFTSPLVAAITKTKMSFSVQHKTEGKPQTYDLTQGELPLDGDDMTTVLDTKSLAKEAAEAAKAEPKGKGGKDGKVEEFPANPPSPDESSEPPAPAPLDKPSRRGKKD